MNEQQVALIGNLAARVDALALRVHELEVAQDVAAVYIAGVMAFIGNITGDPGTGNRVEKILERNPEGKTLYRKLLNDLAKLVTT